jgi:hypothetical protein
MLGNSCKSCTSYSMSYPDRGRIEELATALHNNPQILSLRITTLDMGTDADMTGAIGKLVRDNTTLTCLSLKGVSLISANIAFSRSTLIHLTLADANLESPDGHNMGVALVGNKFLRTLWLQGCEISGLGLCNFADALATNSTLTELLITSNDIRGDAGLVSVKLADSIQWNTSLNTLRVDGLQAWDLDTEEAWGGVLRSNTTLTVLSLTGSDKCVDGVHPIGMGVGGGVAIGDALSFNSTLTHLGLHWRDIEDQGSISLANGLKRNTSLRTLSLNNMKVTANGAIALSEMLRVNNTLKNLELRYSGLCTTVGERAISLALVETPKRGFNLSGVYLWRLIHNQCPLCLKDWFVTVQAKRELQRLAYAENDRRLPAQSLNNLEIRDALDAAFNTSLLTFLMTSHKRLGAASLARYLDDNVLEMVAAAYWGK